MGTERLPTRGKFVDNGLVELFIETIDQLIADMGRSVTIYLPPSTSGCPNCKMGFDESSQGVYNSGNPFSLNGPYNKPFPQGGLCPVCKGSHEIKTAKTCTYTALIQRAPEDLQTDATGRKIDPQNVYLTKMKLVAFEDLRIAEQALIDGVLCVPIREPVKTGLRDLAYVRQWWMRQDR